MSNSSIEHVYGINTVQQLIEHSASRILTVAVSQERRDQRLLDVLDAAGRAGIAVETLDRHAFAAHLESVGIDGSVNHQHVLASCRPAEQKDEAFLHALVRKSGQPVLLLILDGVTDPHNLGACLRSANAAGAQAVVVPQDKAVGMTPVVRKVASGAAEITPLVVVKNLARCIQALQQDGVWVMGAAGEAEQTLHQLDLTVATAIVMGSEGSGLRRLTRDRCDALFSISMGGTVESLNVSVAAGVCLFEARRQRLS